MKELGRALRDAVRMAEHAYRLRSFNTLAEIVAGVSHCAIERLPRRVWDGLDEPTRESLARLSNLCSPMQNYGRYRSFLSAFTQQRANEAAVPLMPVILRDITFICDANPDTLQENGATVANWQKVQLLGAQLSNVMHFKRVPYPFRLRREVLEPLLKSTPLNETELYDQLAYINEQLRAPAVSIRQVASRDMRIDVEQLLQRPIQSWSSAEVAAWMRTVSMNEWAPVMQDARIDGAQLITLDNDKLIALGFVKLGVRKRLQRHLLAVRENRFAHEELPDLSQTSELPRAVQQWTPDHVQAWLRSLGETEVLHFFHSATGKQLLEMNEASLTEMGIVRLGTRKRLMRELRQLAVAAGVAHSGDDNSDESSAASSASPPPLFSTSSPMYATSGSALSLGSATSNSSSGYTHFSGSQSANGSSIIGGIRARSLETVSLEKELSQSSNGGGRDRSDSADLHRRASAPTLNNGRDPRKWTLDDVLSFLDMHELSEYGPAFFKAGVRGERLVCLGDNELTALGVTKIGHRKKLIRAVKELAVTS